MSNNNVATQVEQLIFTDKGPLDFKSSVADIATFNALPRSIKWEGMEVYVISTKKWMTYNEDTNALDPRSGGSLENDLVIVLPPGRYLGALTNGDIVPAGTSYEATFNMMGRQYTAAVFNNPSLSLASTKPSSSLYEVGEYLEMIMTSTYNQNDAGASNNASLVETTDGDGEWDGGATTASVNVFEQLDVTIEASGVQSFRSIRSYDAGTVQKPNSFGVLEPNTIGAGTVQSNIFSFGGVYPVYILVSDNPITPNQATFDLASRVQNGALQISSSGTITVNFNTGPTVKYCTFMVHDSYPTKQAWFVNELNKGSIGGNSNLFGDYTIVQVDDNENGYWSTQNYKFYTTPTSTILNELIQLRNS